MTVFASSNIFITCPRICKFSGFNNLLHIHNVSLVNVTSSHAIL